MTTAISPFTIVNGRLKQIRHCSTLFMDGAIVLMAGIREKIEYNDVPESFQGTPIVLVTAGLMAIAFFGFSGLI